ncbi:MAG: hypothetical protein ACRDK7_15310 [Solirubrobacteraceae bacterium]
MTPLATSIPGSSNNGYVAAAYIVFFAIVLVYVAIMALRLTRVERSLRELNEREQATSARAGGDGHEPGETQGQSRERQTA